MQRTSSGTLVIWAVIGAVLAPVVDVLLESQGFSLPGLPWFAIIGMLILAAVLLVLGWPIKKWNEGDRTKEIDSLHSPRSRHGQGQRPDRGRISRMVYGKCGLLFPVSTGDPQ